MAQRLRDLVGSRHVITGREKSVTNALFGDVIMVVKLVISLLKMFYKTATTFLIILHNINSELTLNTVKSRM